MLSLKKRFSLEIRACIPLYILVTRESKEDIGLSLNFTFFSFNFPPPDFLLTAPHFLNSIRKKSPVIAIIPKKWGADLRNETQLSHPDLVNSSWRSITRYYDGNIYYCKHNGGGTKYFIPFRSIRVISPHVLYIHVTAEVNVYSYFIRRIDSKIGK